MIQHFFAKFCTRSLKHIGVDPDRLAGSPLCRHTFLEQMADELAPAHCRVQPQWIAELFLFCSPFAKKRPPPFPDVSKETCPFTRKLPHFMLHGEEMSIDGVWPMEGDTVEIKHYYWPGAGTPAGADLDPSFPPRGVALHVASTKNSPHGVENEFARLNCDTIYLAWLMAFRDQMKRHGDNVGIVKKKWADAIRFVTATVEQVVGGPPKWLVRISSRRMSRRALNGWAMAH